MFEQLDFKSDVFRLVRVGAADSQRGTDDFFDLRNLVLACEDSYPGISKWFDNKVSIGLRTGERSGFVGLINGRPIAAAILKKGQNSKFCHLKINASDRSRSLGDLFFLLMSLEIRHSAKRVRFTLPESVWEDRKAFFSDFSFQSAEKCARQYRLFDEELFSQTDFSNLFAAAKRKLPKIFGQLAVGNHSMLTGAVLAVQPTPLAKILSGEKTVEIRTRFSESWEGMRASLYGTAPISGLAGEVKLSKIVCAPPNKIWELWGHAAGCTRSEFDAYTRNRDKVYALLLSDVTRYSDPVPLVQISHLLGVDLPPPQSYLSLANSDNWLTAVALAAALQGSIQVSSPKPQHLEVSAAAPPAMRVAF